MAKKNRANQNQQAKQPPIRTASAAESRSPGDTKTVTEAQEAISSVHGQALRDATAEDIDLALQAAPSRIEELDLVKVARELSEALVLLQARAARMTRLEEGEQTLKTAKESFAADKEALGRDRTALDTLQRTLDAKKKEIEQKEELLRVRELNAEAGFAAERRTSLSLLEQEASVLRDELSRARTLIATERADWDARWQQEDQRYRAELEQLRRQQMDALATEARELDAQKRQMEREASDTRADLKKQKTEVEVGQDLLREDREAFDLKVAQRASAALEAAAAAQRDLEARLEAARKERDELFDKLRERDEAMRSLGNRPLHEVKQEMDALLKENKSLATRLARRPGEEVQAQLEALQRAQEEWEADRAKLSQEVLASRAAAARSSIAVTELESLRDQKAAVESSRDLLQAALEELRKDVDDRIRRTDGVSPFPSCAQMDQDEALQSRVPMSEDIPDLATFCIELQHRVAHDPSSGKELYYSLQDIRSFLAGMATSRLHLLQGISGTGKTSLPLAVARALGAGSALIEVQAGWRDRQDLIGHFNAFERRFYESEFLQALYRAQTPRYEGGLFIVVLDEMNLSHPEQYFADLLSALEQDPKYQKLDLMTASVEPAPARLQNGRTLPLPQNVWFVGTANHDETTKDFAPKTYDRAHVMELPRHRAVFSPKKARARPPVSLSALQTAFGAARSNYDKEARQAYSFVDTRFADLLGNRFGVGWGNRLERQMLSYVPVVLAAGGTVSEAVDHIVATKLLHKIRDRHDTRPEDLDDLRQLLDAAWQELTPGSEPVKSREIVSLELRRRGGDETA